MVEFLLCVFGSQRSDINRLNKDAEFKEKGLTDLKSFVVFIPITVF